MKKSKGFSLIELLVVVGIIGILGTIVIVVLGPARTKAKDTKRKVEISQIGRFFSMSCFLPDAGDGVYDLADLIVELQVKYPQYSNVIKKAPKDPSSGTDIKTNYVYEVTNNGSNCVLYANLENENEPITLNALVDPTPGGGSGVLKASAAGWNGTDIYYQFSN